MPHKNIKQKAKKQPQRKAIASGGKTKRKVVSSNG